MLFDHSLSEVRNRTSLLVQLIKRLSLWVKHCKLRKDGILWLLPSKLILRRLSNWGEVKIVNCATWSTNHRIAGNVYAKPNSTPQKMLHLILRKGKIAQKRKYLIKRPLLHFSLAPHLDCYSKFSPSPLQIVQDENLDTMKDNHDDDAWGVELWSEDWQTCPSWRKHGADDEKNKPAILDVLPH